MSYRLSPRHPALLAGAVLAAAVFLLALAGVLARWQWMEDADWAVLDPLYRYGAAHPGWVHGWDVLCTVFHPAVFRAIALIWIVYLLIGRAQRRGMDAGRAQRREVDPGRRRDNYRLVLFLALTVEASALVIVFIKAIVARPRPSTAMVEEMSLSFPSGHALGTAAAVTAMLFAVSPRLRGRWRPWCIGIGVLIVVVVGVGRVVLNVHHPSDVLAGWALGYLWALAFLPVLTGRPVRAADETPAVPGTSP
ncbi:MAG: phosphatase PAP2 family protein [Mycobacterium sp.]